MDSGDDNQADHQDQQDRPLIPGAQKNSQPAGLRFKRVKIQQIYFQEHLCEEFKNSRFPLPENIRKARNCAIILGFVEAICCVAAFSYYEEARSRIILALCIVNILASIVGFRAKIKLSWYGLLFHASYTIAICGGFYIYVLIDLFFGTNHASDQKHDNKSYSGSVVMAVTSLPLVGIFAMGIYSCCLLIMIDDELQARKKVQDRVADSNVSNRMEGASDQQVNQALRQGVVQAPVIRHGSVPAEVQLNDIENAQNLNRNNNVGQTVNPNPSNALENQDLMIEVLDISNDQIANDECVICMDKKKDTIFYPCGHQCLCQPCGERFRKEARHQVCPICRNRIQDIIKVYK